MAAHLSTHVLDTQSGAPAVGVWVSVYRISVSGTAALARACTNDDGRVANVLGEPLAAGSYRLEFAVGDYWRARGAEPFFDVIAVTVTVSDLSRNYHVPLLLAPFGCTTYRGS